MQIVSYIGLCVDYLDETLLSLRWLYNHHSMATMDDEKERTFRPVIPDSSRIDLSRFKKKQGDEPDFIPHNKGGRDHMAHMFVFTGAMWVGGFMGGGAYGFMEGWRAAKTPSFKVRMNSVLNSVSKRGSKVANVLGVIAYLHTGFSWAGNVLEIEDKTGSQWAVPATAGFLTGGLYKSTAAPRTAILAAVLGSASSCVYSVGSSYVYEAIFGRKGRY